MQIHQIPILLPSELLRTDGLNYGEWERFLIEMVAYGCHDLDETVTGAVKSYLPRSVRTVRARMYILSYCEPALAAQIKAYEQSKDIILDPGDIVLGLKQMWNK